MIIMKVTILLLVLAPSRTLVFVGQLTLLPRSFRTCTTSAGEMLKLYCGCLVSYASVPRNVNLRRRFVLIYGVALDSRLSNLLLQSMHELSPLWGPSVSRWSWIDVDRWLQDAGWLVSSSSYLICTQVLLSTSTMVRQGYFFKSFYRSELLQRP